MTEQANNLTETDEGNLEQFLAEEAGIIRILARQHLVHGVIEIGKHFNSVQARLSREKGGEGKFRQWLKQEFPSWTKSSVYRFMDVYKLSLQCPNLGHWELFDVSGLYCLAAPSTPEAARAEILGRVEAGDRLPHREVKALIAAHTSRQSENRNPVSAQEPLPEPNQASERIPEPVKVSPSADPGLRSASHPAPRPASPVLEPISKASPQEELARPVQDPEPTLAEAIRERDTLRKQVEQLQVQLTGAREEIQSLYEQLAETRKERDVALQDLQEVQLWRKTDEEPEAQKLQETLNLIHAAFVDGKEPQAELNQAPEHVPETVKVPWQNLSLIAKSNQDPEHIKCVLHQDPKLMICSLILTLAKN